MLVSPKWKQGQGWKLLTQFFTPTNWLLSASILLVTALAFRYFATTAGEEDKKYRNTSECLLFIYSCFFNMGNNILPKDAKLRIICLSLGPFALNISAYLQGKLIGAITQPVYYEADNEVSQSNIPVVVQKQVIELLNRFEGEISTYVLTESRRISVEHDLQDVVKYKRTATIVTQHAIQNHRDFMPFLKAQELRNIPVVLYVAKQSTLNKIIKEIILKLVEHGFAAKIISSVKHNYLLYCLTHNCLNDIEKRLRLSCEDLKGAFYLYIAALATSTAMLLLELAYNYIRQKF